MRLSHYFIPTLKENPKEAEIVSHRYMLRAGMIRQMSAGIYTWLPLGYKVLRKIEKIVREEQNRMGAIEMLMPTIQSADLWKKSGRYDNYGKEMLRLHDRHEREMLYGPTNEEMITDIFRDGLISYRDLPRNLYHIQWKFRDELRPRFGVMRGREFFMKDGYSFDLSKQAARHSYNKIFVSYLRTFERMGLKAIPMAADTGPIGGDMSHEFVILAKTGESQIYCHRHLVESACLPENIDYEEDLEPIVSQWTKHYAATDEKHDQARFNSEVDSENQIIERGIEVGHIFYFGTKYTEALGCHVRDAQGSKVALHSGSYGIGVSRLVAAVIESSHDERGIIWPDILSPFEVVIINLKVKDSATSQKAEQVYEQLKNADIDVLYDDTSESAGVKFANMDLIGITWQVIISPKSLASNQLEIKHRAQEERIFVPIDTIVDFMRKNIKR